MARKLMLKIQNPQSLKEEYESGKTMAELAKDYRCSVKTIQNWLRKTGFKARSTGARIKGKQITTEGYVIIYNPNHPNATRDGYVPEHRLMMESVIGRYLTKTEIVHHINEIKTDNRPENLRLFSNASDHIRHHKSKIIKSLCLTKENGSKVMFESYEKVGIYVSKSHGYIYNCLRDKKQVIGADGKLYTIERI